MEDGELVTLVLEEPQPRIDVELESVGRRRDVAPTLVPLGLAVAQDDEPARLVRRLLARMRLERVAYVPGDPAVSVVSLVRYGSTWTSGFSSRRARAADSTLGSPSVAVECSTWR